MKKLVNILLISLLCALPALISPGLSQAADDSFIQGNWSGGSSNNTAIHPANKTGWIKYSTKQSDIDTSVANKVKMVPDAFTVTDDSSADFSNGTLSNIEINGTGASATLGIGTIYQDPFCSSLGQWTNMAFSSTMGAVSPLVRAGNYIYSLWVGGDEGKGFYRWSIANEKWEQMADIPNSTALGAALAYDGSDIIYALIGGNRKDFYAYKISTNTWYSKKDIPSPVGRGGSIVGVSANSKIYAFCGNGSSVFYRYTPPAAIESAGSWTAVESASFGISIGASLVYPGTGNYIYASAGGSATTFAKFDFTASSNAWSSLANCPTGLTWYSDVVYPGTGDYLYAWYGSGRWFGRYHMGSDTWESSSYASSLYKNIELPSLPFSISSRMYLYDAIGDGTELRLLSNHSASSTYRYYPATKKWREESFPRNTSVYFGTDIVYVKSERAVYYMPANGYKEFYKYYLDFTAIPSNNTAVAYQWERLADVSFSGSSNGVYIGGDMAYKEGDNYIYCLQGYYWNGFSRYNLTTKAWEQLAALPQKAYWGGSLVVVGDYVYATGGYSYDSGTYTSYLYKYDPATNTWVTESTNPLGYFYAGTTMEYPGSGDYIYVMRSNSRTEFMRYQISTKTWERKATLPDMNLGYSIKMAYSPSDNCLYLINGHDWMYYQGFCKYSIDSNSWSVLDFPAFQNTYGTLCSSSTQLFYLNPFAGLQVYTFASAAWANPVISAQMFRYSYGSVVKKDADIYFFMNDHSGYVRKYSTSLNKWTGLIKMPFVTTGYGHKAVYPGTGNYIYVSEGNFNKNFWRYDTVNDVWAKRASCPYVFSYGARMVGDSSGIYVCPGSYNGNYFLQFVDDEEENGGSWVSLTNLLDTISTEGNGSCIISSGTYKGIYQLRQNGTVKFNKYDLTNSTWSYLADAPWAVSDGAFLFYPGTGNYIYCLKGGGRDFAKYDLSTNTWTTLSEASISVSGQAGGYYPGTGDIIYFYLGIGHSIGLNFNRYSISENRWDEPIQFPYSMSTGAQMCAMPTGEEIFYLSGGGNTYAQKYNVGTSVWTGLNPAPNGITTDAKAIYPGSGDYIYISRGSGYYDFYRYSVSMDAWANLAVPPYYFSSGSAIAYYKDSSADKEYVFALRGGSTTTFMRYSIDDNSWLEKTSTPSACSTGANLIYPGSGDYLYAVSGNGSTAFWKYSVSSNAWISLTPIPMINNGGILFSPGFGDYLYYFVSYNYDYSYGTNFFYRYSISSDTWEMLPVLPVSLRGQSAAVYPGTGDFIYLGSGYGTSLLMKYLLFSSGMYVSDVKEVGNNNGYGNITWQSNGLGQIDVKVRTGSQSDLSDGKEWGYASKVSINTDLSQYSSVGDKDPYLQYRLRFFCYNLSELPQIGNLSFEYNKFPLSQEFNSTGYNTNATTNRIRNISWNSTLPAGTDLRFQMRTAKDSNGTPGAWGPWLGPAGIQQIPYTFDTAGEYASTSEVVVTNGTAKLSKVLADYLYRQRIIIDNSNSSSSYTNCTVKIEISDTNIEFWQHIADDGSDIRFVDSDGKTPLDYRVLGFSKSKKSASAWVTVPSISQASTKDIYLLYGKSTATTTSNPTLAESLIGTDFYAFMFSFLDIVSTKAGNRVYIEKLNVDGQIIASTYIDFTAVGQKQRYTDTTLTVYHVYSQEPISIFASAVEPTSSSDDDWYTVCGNDLWLWCPSNNYDGDVIISAYSDDTQVKITDYGVGDDSATISLDKGNFWFGWNKVDSRGEVWHIESTKPVTVQAGLINHGEAAEQMRSPDQEEYYFYCPNSWITVTAYENNTNIIIDNMDGTSGDYSGMLNQGKSYKHITSLPSSGINMRTYLWADKPVCVVAEDITGTKGTIFQSADTLVSLGKLYYINTAQMRYLRFVNYEDGGNSISIDDDVGSTTTYVTLGAKGSSAVLDTGPSTYRSLKIQGTKKFAIYAYGGAWGEAITPVFKTTDFNHLMPTYMVAKEDNATSVAANLTGWGYKETITVDNTANDVVLSGFQIAVDVDSDHKDFWKHCRSDGADVRFVDSDDATVLSYYIESFSALEKTARFWVKIPTLSNTAKQNIYMYYNKSDAVSLSNGTSVFEFFDDFSSGLTQWNSRYTNVATVSAIYGMDSDVFIIPAGTSNTSANTTIPYAIVSGRNYEWYWELRWATNDLVDSQTVDQPYSLKYSLLTMSDGPFMSKSVLPNQTISTIGGNFTNSEDYNYTDLKFYFYLTDVDTAQVFNNITSSSFNITNGTTVSLQNVSVTMPADLVKGRLYSWSWELKDQNNDVLFSSSQAPAPLFNIACGFGLTAQPGLPASPYTGGTVRLVNATFQNNAASSLNNLYWRFTLIDSSQDGRTVAKVAHNGYMQANATISPDYPVTAQITWQAANKSGRHFMGVSDPNAKISTDLGSSSYLAGYDVLLATDGYYYDESGNGYNAWESVRTPYTASAWNSEKMTWWPHNPLNGTTGKVIFELSSGDKLTYNAGFVSGSGLSIKPTIRSSKDAIFIDKFMVYKSSLVKPYVGFVFTETLNPTGMDVYYTTNPVVQPIMGVFYDTSHNLTDFAEFITTPDNTGIKYQLSSDGYNWYWWNSTDWVKVTGGYSQTNSAADVKTNLAAYADKFPQGEFWYRAYLHSSNGVDTPLIDNVTVTTTTEPTYYLRPAGNTINILHKDTVDDQWMQYKAILTSVGQETPVLNNITINYTTAYISVTSPNGGETLRVGQSSNITWNSQAIDGTTGAVKLEYSVDSGSSYKTIQANVTNTGYYNWTVPDDPSQNAMVKITSEDFSGVNDTSNLTFRILSLQVISPNGQEIWEGGKQHNITWSSNGLVSNNLTIQYSLNSGASWTTISTQRPNTGFYNWITPSVTSDAAMVKIFDGSKTSISDASDAAFALVPPPGITILTPAQGELWRLGLVKTISWQTNQSQFSPTVDLEYSRDNFTIDNQSIAKGVNTGLPQGANSSNADLFGSFNWTIPDSISDVVRIRVKEVTVPSGRDTATAVSGLSEAFAIVEPIINITSPVASDVWIVNDTRRISWTTEGTISNNLSIEFSSDGGLVWQSIYSNSTNGGNFDWQVPLESEGNSVIVKITDNNRTQVSGESAGFRILGYPTVDIVQPNGGEYLVMGENYEVKWNSWGTKLLENGADYFAMKIFYSLDNGTTWQLETEQQMNDGSYTWEVPQLAVENEKCLIKITDANDAAIIDISNTTFSISNPKITITSPNGGESMYATGNYDITWTARGAINNALTLEYSANAGASWNTIAVNQTHTGIYHWKAADVNSTQVMVRITDAQRPAVTDVSDNTFTIIPPSITVTTPNGGEEWVIGTDHEINWTSIGRDEGAVRDNLTLQYSINSGSTWNTFAVGELNDGAFLWNVPDDYSITCLLKIFDGSRAATQDVSNAVFKIVLPYIEVLTPNGGESWPIGTSQTISWKSVGTISDNLTMAYSKDNFVNTAVVATGIARGNETSDGVYVGSYNWSSVNDDYSTTVKFRVFDGNRVAIHDESNSYFIIANPIIKVVRPNGGELFTVADSENITWQNTGSVGALLKIEYSKDNFASNVNLIADNVSNVDPFIYSWNIPDDVSADIKVRITDNARTVVWDKTDGLATILPVPQLNITAPAGGEIWRVGESRNITWADNGGLVSNNLNLYYATDGGTVWKSIASGVTNSGQYSWKIPDEVSSTCLAKIVDMSRPSDNDTSDTVFSIADPVINITSPNGGEIWAVGDKAPVAWSTIGGVSDSLVLEFSPDGGANYYFVATVENSGAYTWTVPDYITSNAIFRIHDAMRPVTTDSSDKSFVIAALPTISVAAPNGGEVLVLGDVYDITWNWTGLSISDNLVIENSNDNFATRQIVASAVPNTGRYSWTIPESSITGTTLKIRITDGNRTVITDKSDGYFRIRGGFTVTSPDGGEYWVAKSSQDIDWNTRGTISTVNLEYSTDNTTWQAIASGVSNTGTYRWTVPNIQSANFKVRITDPNDPTVADISNTSFSVIYATVRFQILDYDTSNHLSDFSVSEPSTGWTDSGVNSPITRNLTYPYGTFTTFFTKTGYIDNSATWTPPKQGTDVYVITVNLENSASAQVTWDAILTYSYSPADDSISAVGSLQRKGKLVGVKEEERTRMGMATLTIYQPDGTTVRKQLTSSTPNTSGMYTFTYVNTQFESGKVYPATLSVVYNDNSYTSSANIDVGAEKLQYEFFTQTAAKLAESVEHIESTVVASAIQTAEVVDTVRTQLTSKLSDVDASLKSHVTSVLTTTESNLVTRLDETNKTTSTGFRSEILNTENTVKSGEALSIRFRTFTGLAPVIDVYDSKNAQKITKGTMKEMGVTGVYYYSVNFVSSWGQGPCTIVCSESTRGGLDALVIEVVSSDIESVSGQVAAILGSTTGLSAVEEVSKTMGSQFAMIESVLTKVGNDIVKEVKTDISSNASLSAVFDQLTSVSKQMKQMSTDTGNVVLEKLYQVSSEGKSDIVYLKNKTQELKASMELTHKLIENSTNKPVTQTWYEYK